MKHWGFEENVPEHWRSREATRAHQSRRAGEGGLDPFLSTLCPYCGVHVGAGSVGGHLMQAHPIPGAPHPGQRGMVGLLKASLPSFRAQPTVSAWVQRPPPRVWPCAPLPSLAPSN